MSDLYCYSQSDVGKRRDQEDTSYIGKVKHFIMCGVFDGHAGKTASYFLRDNIEKYVDRAIDASEGSIENALIEAFVAIDRDIIPDLSAAGSTAVVCLVDDKNIFCANCGDSRAVLARKGKVIALSEDHKPRGKEAERVKAEGGFICCISRHDRTPYVGARLAMTRAIGDSIIEGVIAIPEVVTLVRHDDDEFIVIASDGLWDVVTNEDAVSLMRICIERCLSEGHSREFAMRVACKTLIECAKHNKSRDNITVVVLDLA